MYNESQRVTGVTIIYYIMYQCHWKEAVILMASIKLSAPVTVICPGSASSKYCSTTPFTTCIENRFARIPKLNADASNALSPSALQNDQSKSDITPILSSPPIFLTNARSTKTSFTARQYTLSTPSFWNSSNFSTNVGACFS